MAVIVFNTQHLLELTVPILIWLVLLTFFLTLCFAVQDGLARLKQLHEIPCNRCVYFTGSHHLKCTIHPCIAQTEDAISCHDFEPVPQVHSRPPSLGRASNFFDDPTKI